MPITGPSSYPSTTEAFISHWMDVNAALPPGSPLTVGEDDDKKTLADLSTLSGELTGARATLTGDLLDLTLARGTVKELEDALQPRFNQFVSRVRGSYAGKAFERALPKAPNWDASDSKVIQPLDAMTALWTKINTAQATPLLLADNYDIAAWAASFAALRTAYTAVNMLEAHCRLSRELRNDLQDEIYEILKLYRVAVPSAFAPGNALIDSLPRLSPLPGSTPDAVSVSASYDATAHQAVIGWTASTDANLDRYEVRGVPGPDYSGDDEAVLGTVEKDEPREFRTDFALGTPGAVASFKVYVVLTTDNEAGSNAVKVTRT